MVYISLLLVLLLPTLSTANSCKDYENSNQSWCAEYELKVCQDTIDGINAKSECDEQNIFSTQPCKLPNTINLLALVTSADAAFGLWIVVLYSVIGIGEVLHCLKACSQVFYWSALFLILADLGASTLATLLTGDLNTQAKNLEEAGVCVCYLVVPMGI